MGETGSFSAAADRLDYTQPAVSKIVATLERQLGTTLVDRGMPPLQAIRAATTVAAELIDVDDRGRLVPGLLADVVGVPGDPLTDIGVTENVRFVMKGGRVHRHDDAAK